MQTVQISVSSNFDWSWKLASELRKLAIWKEDLWSALIGGWSDSQLTDDPSTQILKLFDEAQELYLPIASDVARLLEGGVKKAAHPIPNDCLDLAGDLALKVWNVVSLASQEPKRSSKEPDWVARAINHSSGSITLFWLSFLVRLCKSYEENWKGIPANIKNAFELVLKGETYSADLGRVLLASQLSFLFSSDEKWTVDHILPLFDWAANEKRALLPFHGFLTWGQQTEPLVSYLLPLYRGAFFHITDFGRNRDHFNEYLAALAVISSLNPLTSGWLTKFLMAAERQDRLTWASYV